MLCCASEKQLEQFKKDNLRKEFHQLIREIEKHEAFKEGILSQVKETSWAIMNSFTHSGFYQVVRRIKEGEISPDYADEEIINVLQSANSFAILTAGAIANMAKNERLAKEIYDRGMECSDSKS